MLRNTEQAPGYSDNEKLQSHAFKLGFTNRELNSGADFEVSDIFSENVKGGSTFSQDNIWVEKYAPHTYADLISDEVHRFSVCLISHFTMRFRNFWWIMLMQLADFLKINFRL